MMHQHCETPDELRERLRDYSAHHQCLYVEG